MQTQWVVVRRHDHHASGSGRLRVTTQRDGLRGRLCTGVRNHRYAPTCSLDDGLAHTLTLSGGHRGELTRRTQWNEPVDASRHHAINVIGDASVIDAAILGKGRDKGNENSGEGHRCAPDRARAGMGRGRRTNRSGVKGSSWVGRAVPSMSSASARDVPGPSVMPSMP